MYKNQQRIAKYVSKIPRDIISLWLWLLFSSLESDLSLVYFLLD